MTTAERLRGAINNSTVLTLSDLLNTADELETLTKERDDLRVKLSTAYSALRSYQYGNSSPELAEKIADAIEATLKGETK